MTQAGPAVDDPISIDVYDDHLEAAHSRFAERMWPARRRRRVPGYNRWKFRGPESGPVNGFLVAVSGGEVIGQLGLIPATLRMDGKSVAAQWACDLMVDSSRRRRGIGSMLFNAAITRGMVTLGSNPSAAADVTMQRIGFRSLRGPAMAVFPLDPAHVLGWKLPASYALTSAAVASALRPLMRWRGRRILRTAAHGAPAVAIGDWRTVAADVAAAQERSPDPFIAHDAEFLAWRCNGLTGYVQPLTALRAPAGSYAIIGNAPPYHYVYDWTAASWEEFQLLFTDIARRAIAGGAKTIQAYGQTAEEQDWLRRAGFIMLRKPCHILCHPPEKLIPKFSRMRYSIFDSDGNL